MAEVYKAYQPSMDRNVALKVLPGRFAHNSEFVERFRREARLIAGLQHAHIVPVYDHGDAEGRVYLVMPLMENGTIATRVRGRRLPIEEVIRVGMQIGDALDYAHNKGMVHRDVKPGNILLDAHGNCLLSDFGVAQLSEDARIRSGNPEPVGTPQYMSPEAAAGLVVDHRSDLYSLGVVLYELACGQRPFDGDDEIKLKYDHIHNEPPDVRAVDQRVPEALAVVIMTLLAKQPAERFSRASELVRALSMIRVKPSVRGLSAIRNPFVRLNPPPIGPHEATVLRPAPSRTASATHAPPADMPATSQPKTAAPRQADKTPGRIPPMFRPAQQKATAQQPGVALVLLLSLLGVLMLGALALLIAGALRLRVGAPAIPSPTPAPPTPAAAQAPGVALSMAASPAGRQPAAAPTPLPTRAYPTETPLAATAPVSTPIAAIAAQPPALQQTETPIAAGAAGALPPIPFPETPLPSLVALPNTPAPPRAEVCRGAPSVAFPLSSSALKALGCPQAQVETGRAATVQAFERGVIIVIARRRPATSAVIALANDGRAWRAVSRWTQTSDEPGTWYSCEVLTNAAPAETGIPWREHGAAWCGNPALRDALGKATANPIIDVSASVQRFASGLALSLNNWPGLPGVPASKVLAIFGPEDAGGWE